VTGSTYENCQLGAPTQLDIDETIQRNITLMVKNRGIATISDIIPMPNSRFFYLSDRQPSFNWKNREIYSPRNLGSMQMTPTAR
jgi:hypothetical protein